MGNSTRVPQGILMSPHALTNFPSESFGLDFGGILSIRRLSQRGWFIALSKGAHNHCYICSPLLKCQVPGSPRLPDSPFGKEWNQFSSMGWPILRLKILQGTPVRPLRVMKEKLHLSQGLYTLVMNDTIQIPWTTQEAKPTIPRGELFSYKK